MAIKAEIETHIETVVEILIVKNNTEIREVSWAKKSTMMTDLNSKINHGKEDL